MQNVAAYWRRSEMIWAALEWLTWIGFALLACVILFGCSDSTTAPTAVASQSPSPEPSPAAAKMIVKQSVFQNGQAMTDFGVSANRDFKIVGDAQCFDDADQQITCPLIPYWAHRQTSGFGANCTQFGSESDNYAVYYCKEPMFDAVFETCALDWDRHEVGCDSIHLNIG